MISKYVHDGEVMLQYCQAIRQGRCHASQHKVQEVTETNHALFCPSIFDCSFDIENRGTQTALPLQNAEVLCVEQGRKSWVLNAAVCGHGQ